MTFLIRGLDQGKMHICVRINNVECGNLKMTWPELREIARNKYIRFAFV